MKKDPSFRCSKMKRVGVFVDVQNIFYSAKEYYQGKVDFEKLLELALRERQLIFAYAYVITSEEVNQSGFISVLEKIGFKVKTKPLKRRPDGSARGDWDMGIAIDTILFAPKLDVVVLVSGDGDFIDLVKVLKALGSQVEIISFPQNTSEELKKCADLYIPISEELIIKKNSQVVEQEIAST